MKVSKEAIAIVKKWEGFRAQAYLCPAGIWTIGYGTTAAAGVGISPREGMRITEAQADKYLNMALDKFADSVRSAIKVPVNENQFGACVSLAYNIGSGAFRRSTLLRKLNAGDYNGAAAQFAVWNKAGGKTLRGLVGRRADEAALFRKPPPASVPARQGFIAIILKLLGIKK